MTDFVREGRRINLIYEVFEADLTDFMAWKKSRQLSGKSHYTVTAFVAYAFAKTLTEYPEMQAYRGGLLGNVKIVFDDIDIALMIEKPIHGESAPWIHTIRGCNRQSMASFSAAIQRAKNEPIETNFRWHIGRALMHLPTFIRRLAWLLPRHNPYFMKFLVGTVAVTSVGMFCKGSLALLPATPLTLTLAIGSIDKRPVFDGNSTVEHDRITLSICADHSIVDGAPLARFISAMQEKLKTPGLLIEAE